MTRAIALSLFLIVLAGCDRTPASAAPGTAPEGRFAVGPVPGPSHVVSGAANPLSGSDAARTDGRRLFVRFNCSGCHGGRAGGGMGPSLRDVDWLYGSSDMAIFASIAEGRGKGMPAWGARIPDDQIWRLVAYIRSLRTSNEPDPPS